MKLISICLTVCLLITIVATCEGQVSKHIHFDRSAPAAPAVGKAVFQAGDVNADGFNDFVVTNYPRFQTAYVSPGLAEVRSGLDGSLIHSLATGVPSDAFGTSAAGGIDINSDGYDDVLVGAPETNGFGFTAIGKVYAYSGFDGSILYEIFGLQSSQRFGSSIAVLDDLDSDGVPEIAINTIESPNLDADVGVFSGASGTPIATIVDPSIIAFGYKIENPGDVDGDGVGDLLVASRGFASNVVTVRVYSGADGSTIHSFSASDLQIVDMAGMGDLNGDGNDDFAVILRKFNLQGMEVAGTLRVFSGADASTLIDQSLSYISSVAAPKALDSIGDVNGDGVNDIGLGVEVTQPVAGIIRTINTVRLIDGISGNEIGILPVGNHAPMFQRSMEMANLGDINGDGKVDFAASIGLTSPTGDPASRTVVYLGGIDPVASYVSSSGVAPDLSLSWDSTGQSINFPQGDLVCTGATPGASGLMLASLARADLPISGFDLLVAVDSINLIQFGNLGANFVGEMRVPGLTRRQPAIAGTVMHLQCFETGPIVQASNGLSLVIIP